MKNILEILSQSPLFASINPNQLTSLLSCLSAREVEFGKDAYIHQAGSTIQEVGIVLSGSVNIIQEDFWGNRTILSKLGPSELFGESFCSANLFLLPVSVVTTEPSTILFIQFQKIITTCSSTCVFHTTLIHNLVTLLAMKNIMLTFKIGHMAKRSTKDKLLSFLSHSAILAKSNSFSIPYSRQELADYLCVDRSAMSNELSKLKEDDLIDFHKNSFHLK